MNRLILVGNGFDLAHGLKTKYSDFMLWYIKDCMGKFLNNLQYEDELISIAQSRIAFPRMKEFETIDQINDFLKSYNIKLNFKFNFFKDLFRANADYKWVNIEYEYYLQLVRFYRDLEFNNFKDRTLIINTVKGFNDGFELIKKKLIEYLKFVDCENKKINLKIRDHISELMYHSSRENGKSKVLYLNFNYTNTLEQYISNDHFENPGQTIYIHGKLDEPENPIIFGYGDEMDGFYQKIESLNANEFMQNIKSFGYFKTDNYRKFKSFINPEPFEVWVMGHSCGITDRILLSSIFEHKNCDSIRIFYHQIDKNTDDYFEKTQEISRHFSQSNKDVMRDKIVDHKKCTALVPI